MAWYWGTPRAPAPSSAVRYSMGSYKHQKPTGALVFLSTALFLLFAKLGIPCCLLAGFFGALVRGRPFGSRALWCVGMFKRDPCAGECEFGVFVCVEKKPSRGWFADESKTRKDAAIR